MFQSVTHFKRLYKFTGEDVASCYDARQANLSDVTFVVKETWHM